jgi:hypothetical protein
VFSKTLLLSEYSSEAAVNKHFFPNLSSVIDFPAAAMSLAL